MDWPCGEFCTKETRQGKRQICQSLSQDFLNTLCSDLTNDFQAITGSQSRTPITDASSAPARRKLQTLFDSIYQLRIQKCME